MSGLAIPRHKEATVTYWQITIWVLLAAGFALSSVRAQEQTAADPHAEHITVSSPATPSEQEADRGAAETEMASMQGGSAPADARDPHAYSDGYDFGPYSLRMMDTHSFGSLLVDNLESVRSNGTGVAAYDMQAWYGRLYDRLVLKGEGDVDGGEIGDTRSELLWGHAVATFWDSQLGLRVDTGGGPTRSWLAVGVQGLAPYWFEVEATAYLGEAGRTAFRLNVSYDVLLTQKLILQPRIETETYGKRDAERGLGSGLADVSAALRLRYEIRREFAPYLGVEWERKFGGTGDFARAAGEDVSETRFIAGLRFWF